MSIGQKIASLRKEKNLTQAELGERLSITAQAVSKWENDLSEPDIESIKKICEIFEVSIAKFLDMESNIDKTEETEETEEKPKEEVKEEKVKIINGYCENCNIPVGPNEYKVTKYSYNPSKLGKKVEESTTQHIYCNSCFSKIIATKQQEERNEIKRKQDAEKAEAKCELKKGLIWGSILFVLFAVITIVLCAREYDKNMLIGGILTTLGGLTLTTALIWDSYITDVFFWFMRSISSPFNFIFELSLDGILWLITVKLLMWILCGLLSVLLFCLGLIISLILSIPSFPFILASKIRETKA